MRRLALVGFICLVTASCFKLDLTGAISGPVGSYSLDVSRTEQLIYGAAEQQMEEALRWQPEEKRQETRDRFHHELKEKKEDARKQWSEMQLRLILEPNGDWRRIGHSGNEPEERVTGTWEQRGEKLIFTTREKNGKATTQPEVEEASYKNGEISFPIGFGSSVLVFTRG
jgi:hypothetical protein